MIGRFEPRCGILNPIMEIIIVLALAALIFGPRTLWRMRRRHQGRS
jgi:hypothetical protein